jgi:hypothetical protein
VKQTEEDSRIYPFSSSAHCCMQAQAKWILIDVLTQALRDDETAWLKRRLIAQADEEWQEHEIIRDKATPLGLGAAVDYPSAKAMPQGREDHSPLRCNQQR